MVRDGAAFRAPRAGQVARRLRAFLVLLLPAALAGCTQTIRYTDELVDPRTGRSLFVRAPAIFGGVVGFLAGVPVDVAALPVTYPVYKAQDEATVDPLSIFLFPSFVLSRAGVLVGMPFDVLEYLAYRMWRPEDTLTAEERERLELQYDEDSLPNHPVEWIYPRR